MATADLLNMNRNNGSTPQPNEQRLRERAERLYMMGEWNLAAQLLLELTAAGHSQPEDENEAVHA